MTYSVIIATYNRCAYALDAIRSVVDQTFPALEIIVVVDGSTDGTSDAVRAAFPNIKLIEQPNRGPSIAHNAGIAAASGEWICFLDDDDMWHREKLSCTNDYLAKHPECTACNTPVWWFSENETGPVGAFGFRRDFVARSLEECHAAVAQGDPSHNNYDYLEIQGKSFERLRECNRGALSSSVVRRDVLITAGGFSPMQTCGDDWTMFLNVARIAEWHTIPRRLTFSRLHLGQNTGDPSNGLYTLIGYANAWLAGRGCIERKHLEDVAAVLASYGERYRSVVQGYLWSALRRGDILTASMIRRVGLLLLPRFRDRIYVMIPPPITWRIERYLLGMHK